MTAPSTAALTTATYALTNGLTYNKTFGTIVVSFQSACPTTVYAGITGDSIVTINPGSDVTAADWNNAVASLASLGIVINTTDVPLTAAGGETYFGLTL